MDKNRLIIVVPLVAIAISPGWAQTIIGRPGDNGRIIYNVQNAAQNSSAMENLTLQASYPAQFVPRATSVLGPLTVQPGSSQDFEIDYDIASTAPDGQFFITLNLAAPSYVALTPPPAPVLVSVTVDGTPPTITVDDLGGNTLQANDQTSVSGVIIEGTDAGSGVAQISLKSESTSLNPEIFENEADAIAVFDNLLPGLYTATVVDAAGNSASLSFKVVAPPTITILSPLPPPFKNTVYDPVKKAFFASVEIAVAAPAGLDSLAFFTQPNEGSLIPQTLPFTPGDTQATPVLTLPNGTGLPDGSVKIVAVDLSGTVTVQNFSLQTMGYNSTLSFDQGSSLNQNIALDPQYNSVILARQSGVYGDLPTCEFPSDGLCPPKAPGIACNLVQATLQCIDPNNCLCQRAWNPYATSGFAASAAAPQGPAHAPSRPVHIVKYSEKSAARAAGGATATCDNINYVSFTANINYVSFTASDGNL